ncbi:hypothetical protein [Nocardia sp. SC052]|uniref:hypothetical protein n=1 Tax=Nocardia sichangensis TaxID=3385975 RepID=UPI0039A0FAE7
MPTPLEFTTPGGHFTISTRGWTTEERPQVLAELRPLIAGLRLAFPELDNGATLTGLAHLSGIVANAFNSDDTDQAAAYTELAADDLR